MFAFLDIFLSGNFPGHHQVRFKLVLHIGNVQIFEISSENVVHVFLLFVADRPVLLLLLHTVDI